MLISDLLGKGASPQTETPPTGPVQPQTQQEVHSNIQPTTGNNHAVDGDASSASPPLPSIYRNNPPTTTTTTTTTTSSSSSSSSSARRLSVIEMISEPLSDGKISLVASGAVPPPQALSNSSSPPAAAMITPHEISHQAAIKQDNMDYDYEEDEDNSRYPSLVSSPALSVSAMITPGKPNTQVYSAIYSGVPVYEMVVKGVPVMRRSNDSFLNATQLLKIAGFNKPKRTKILEKEVLQGHHEKVQGGYGKYQGTWIPREAGRELAQRYNVEHLILPLLNFEDENGDIAMTKANFIAKEKSAAALALKNSQAANLSEVDIISNSSVADSPVPTPSSSPPGKLNQYSQLSVGRPRKSSPGVSQLRNQPARARRGPAAYTEPDSDEDGTEDDISTDDTGHREETPFVSTLSKYKLPSFQTPVYSTHVYSDGDVSPVFSKQTDQVPVNRTETVEKQNLTLDQRQREIIMAIFLNGDPSTIIHLLRDPNTTNVSMDENTFLPDPNPDLILDDYHHTALHWSTTFARLPLIKSLIMTYSANIRAVNINGETALLRAVSSTHCFDQLVFPDVLSLLGSSIRSADYDGSTILHRIAARSQLQGHASACIYYTKCIAKWIERGGFLNFVDENRRGETRGMIDARKMALALVNAQNEDGDTALHIAIKTKSRTIVMLLLKMGANKDITNYDGVSVLSLAEGDAVILGILKGSYQQESQMYEVMGWTSSIKSQPSPPKNEVLSSIPTIALNQINAAKNELADFQRSKSRIEKIHQKANSIKARLDAAMAVPATPPAPKTLPPLPQATVTPMTSPPQPSFKSQNDTTATGSTTTANMDTSNPSTGDIISSSTDSQSKKPEPNTQLTPSSNLGAASLLLPTPHPSPLQTPDVSAASTASATPVATIESQPGVGIIGVGGTPALQVSPVPAHRIVALENSIVSDKMKVAELEDLKMRVEVLERSRKRFYEELDQICVERSDKDRRYKKLMAGACNVTVEQVEELIKSVI